MNGKSITHYLLESFFGSGGMGEADQARDTRLRRSVAVEAGKAPPEQLNITLNWFEELKQRVPVK